MHGDMKIKNKVFCHCIRTSNNYDNNNNNGNSNGAHNNSLITMIMQII